MNLLKAVETQIENKAASIYIDWLDISSDDAESGVADTITASLLQADYRPDGTGVVDTLRDMYVKGEKDKEGHYIRLPQETWRLVGQPITITPKSPIGKDHTYEVVTRIPPGFCVWNIGKNMGDDYYIPLCQSADTGICAIRTDTLKAIRLSKAEVQVLRKAAHFGVNSKDSALHQLKHRPAMKKRERLLAEKALAIFERLS